ncbi:MAG TPA: adenylate/guanylate cyclase domain-containing protein [Candidatus Dormibacteraeota bacterium]|nr:adenylate/guanylate cyclase domain-containing protein [Candidatus Dormibacteraeota bacterium]
MTCSVCGRPLPNGARFCPNCGAAVGPLVGTEERKVVTVLFADIVDSTGHGRRLDAERAREVLGQFFGAASEELLALRGRPEKFIGDAVMAVFGLPQVHEDDALRAVRAGLAIRGRTRQLGEAAGLAQPLEVRIGIETGEAAMGRNPSGQMLVTGPVVNATARLQTAAKPGQILAGSTTHQLTKTTVSYGRRRRIRAKGFDSGLDAYPVEGLTMRSARRTIPFVGRTNEQAVLDQSLGLASSSGRPVLVTVVGEPGIGKSRLADELAAGVGATVVVLRGRPRSYTDTASFSPAAAIVGDLAGIEAGDPPEKVRRLLRELVERLSEPSDADRTIEQLALLFGMAERRDEAAFVNDVLAGFVALIDGLARDHPVLIVFEDAHSLHPPMLDLIERVASPGRGGPRRVLVVALARSELLETRPNWGSTSGNAVLLRLDPLSPEESIHLVRHAGGGHIAEPQAAEIAERAGGNPFFIIETTGMLMPSGEAEAARARSPIPPTVQAVIGARLDALPARLRDLARKASVFMYDFDLDELAVVDDAANLDELQALEEAELMVRDDRASMSPIWRMRHATLKDVAYASLPKRERLRLHTLIAENLVDEGHRSLAADHYELAAIASLDLDPNDREAPDRAADALLVAGDRARRRMEIRSAIDRYDRALIMAGPQSSWGTREARILAGLGEARYWLAEYRLATEALTRAVTLAEANNDDFALTLALRFLGDIAINFEADVDKAEKLLDRSLQAAEKLGDSWAVVRTLLFAGWVPWTRQQYDESEAIWRRALAVVDAKDYWARVRALTALSINRTEMKDLEAALKLIDEASALAEETGDQFSVANTSVQKARVFDDLGRHEEALPWFDRGIAIFSELGARWEMADARAARGIAKRELGRLDEADEDLRYAIRIAEELGDRQLPGWTWRALARVAELRGDKAEAEEHWRRSKEAESRGPH